MKPNQRINKCIIFSNRPFNGGYRYKDVFQLIPPSENWLKPEAILADHPLIIEHCKFTSHSEESIDLGVNGFDETPDWFKKIMILEIAYQYF